jgi:hypothetical protein
VGARDPSGLLVVGEHLRQEHRRGAIKVPDDWKLYKLDPNPCPTIVPSRRRDRREPAPGRGGSCSVRTNPTSPLRGRHPAGVVGQAEISPIGESVRDQVSNVDLRAFRPRRHR